MTTRQVVLCNPVRTAIGTYGGSFKDIPAPDLGAAAIREVLKRSGLVPDKVQAVVMGNVIQAGVRVNPARQRALARDCRCRAQRASVRAASSATKRAVRSARSR